MTVSVTFIGNEKCHISYNLVLRSTYKQTVVEKYFKLKLTSVTVTHIE